MIAITAERFGELLDAESRLAAVEALFELLPNPRPSDVLAAARGEDDRG